MRWFHSGGIFAALSETTSELIIEGMQAAKAAGAVNSFDLNYRAKLWASVGGAASAASRCSDASSANVDALIGNEEDLQKGLGIAGPEVEAGKSKLDPDTFFSMIDRVVEQHPEHQAGGDDAARGPLDQPPRLGRRAVARRQALRQPDVPRSTCIDRIGGGDGFAAGLIYGLLTGRSPEEALRLGWAHGALLTTFPGDVTMAKLDEVEAFAKGGSARVQR